MAYLRRLSGQLQTESKVQSTTHQGVLWGYGVRALQSSESTCVGINMPQTASPEGAGMAE